MGFIMPIKLNFACYISYRDAIFQLPLTLTLGILAEEVQMITVNPELD